MKAEFVAQESGFDGLAVEVALDRIPWLIADCRLAEAQSVLDDVEVRSVKSDNRRYLARAMELRADILEALGDHAGAISAYRDFHRMDRELHSVAAERRSRLTSAALQVEPARRETELAQMRVAELEELDHDKRDFLASVSHELWTPLAAVLGFATELADSWDRFDPEEARGLAHLIARQSADISSIVDDLLTITALEAGTMRVYPKAIDVAEHVRGVVDTLAREAGRRGGMERQCHGLGRRRPSPADSPQSSHQRLPPWRGECSSGGGRRWIYSKYRGTRFRRAHSRITGALDVQAV